MCRGLLQSICVVLASALSAAAEIAPVETPAPSGSYRLDPAHARLVFRVGHLGFSYYTAFLTGLAAELDFAPASPSDMRVRARVDPASVATHHPDPAYDFDAVLAGPQFLDAAQFPDITFTSTSVSLTEPAQAAVTGDLTLRGVTRPVTLRVTFNGGYAGHPLDPGGARIGFIATGTVFRSDFGMTFGLPAPGSDLGVADAVEFRIDAEFINPDASGPQVGP